jgi:polysaccharide biosynthesis transport protein
MSETPLGPVGPSIPERASFSPRETFNGGFEDEQEGVGLNELWLTVRKRLWLLVGIVVSVFILAGAMTIEKTPLYSATAEILLKPDTPEVLDIPQLQGPDPGTEQHDFYSTQYALAKSPELAAAVIRNLSLENNPLFAPPKKLSGFIGEAYAFLSDLASTLKYPWPNSDRTKEPIAGEFGVSPRMIETYLSMLAVAPVVGTQLMDITFTTPDPMLSAQIANAHANAYIDRGLELRREASEIVQAFLRTQLDAIGKRVQESEAALNSYRHKMGILSFQTDNANQLAEARMAELERTLTDAETNRIRLAAEMELIAARHYESLPEVIANPTIQALGPEIDRLAAQYAGMATRFTDRWPALAQIKAQLGAAQAELSQEVAIVTEGVRREYKAAVLRENHLRDLVAAEKEKDFASNDAALKDAILARRVDTNREVYRTVLSRMQEVGIDEEGPVSNATIAIPAVAPRFPSYPEVIKNLAMAVLGGLLVGLGVVFGLEKLDKTFKNVEEVERTLKLPKFALIPDFVTAKRLLPGPKASMEAGRLPVAMARRRRTGSPGILRSLYMPHFSLHYRPLHVALQFSRAGGSPRIVMFTSATPQEGKTVSAAGTAFACSQMGSRTLLVDADLHRPQCHNLVATEDPIGLSDVLAGRRGFAEAVHSGGNGVFVIPAGTHVPNPAALLVSRSMHELLASFGKAFDHVFIDSPPVLVASETIALSTMVDGVILVIGPKTPKKEVLEAFVTLKRAGAPILGFVFNRIDLRLPQHRGHGKYAAYDRYYYALGETDKEIN